VLAYFAGTVARGLPIIGQDHVESLNAIISHILKAVLEDPVVRFAPTLAQSPIIC